MTNFINKVRHSLQVYFITDIGHTNGKSAHHIVEEALAGGVTMLQLREKQAPLRQVIEEGRRFKDLCRQYGIPFIVNDRIDLALLLEADGVHVGQDDIPASEARKILGADKIIGISAGNMEEAELAVSEGADYLGVGAIFATSTKADAGEPVGTGLIKQIRARWPVPIVAIGGISHDNASKVIEAGADGVAVISAISKHADCRYAARRLKQIASKN
jgi:thiamine-phosphate pyrophosphorylase